MPRYHFNVHDGFDLPDPEGSDLPDLRAARIEAVRYAGSLLHDHAVTFWDHDDWRMEVTDEAGLILFSLIFVASDSAASGSGS